jgi:3-hydroxybutyryl-CoA dehydrogenase
LKIFFGFVLIAVFRGMRVVVIGNENQKDELLSRGLPLGLDLVWVEKFADLSPDAGAEAVIDLLFENEESRVITLRQFLPAPVIINSVEYSLSETDPSFIRINAWPGFLGAEVIEASSLQEDPAQRATILFQFFDRKIEWLPDTPGFVTARVISMIINEAFLALEEGVSTKEEINTAMKLGTNYPYGPFEWAERIGIHKVSLLLSRLSGSNPRYTPASLLQQTIESC